MKKILAMVLGVIFTLGLAAQAFAVSPLAVQKGQKIAHRHQGQKQCGEFKDFLKQSLAKNNGDLTKVKADVDKMVAEKKAAWDSRLKEKAAKEGITVDELKTRMQAKRADRLEKMAKEHNMTADQFKAKFQAKHDAKLQELATELGLSVDQLKQVLPTPPVKQ